MAKERTILSRLFDYAGNFKYLTISSYVLSSISALMALVPYIYIWKIIKEILDVMPDYGQAHDIVHNGWMAVIWAVASIIVYVGALLCSHISAFRIAANMRIRTIHHIVSLPNGFMDSVGSGKMRKIVNEASAATETYLAHEQPDKAASIATPLGLIVLLLFFDWRMGLLCLIPIAVAFIILKTFMSGEQLKNSMNRYQEALDRMTNEAVEYVRGIPVLKIFGQSVLSLKKFKSSIDDYGEFTLKFTKDFRIPMLLFVVCINASFAVLVAFTLYRNADNISNAFLLNLLFYIIITPVIGVTMIKIMHMSEEEMIVGESLSRVDCLMNLKPLPETLSPKIPRDNSISLSRVSFKYTNADNYAIHDVSMSIKAGEHIALVGPSGGGKTTMASIMARFWDATGGIVSIGGVDVKDIATRKLTKIVSFVFQDSKLIKGSILENVRMARPQATDEEVIEALHNAQCDDIIAKMPHGVYTYIGTDGVYLSGGEQQRVAIARVMLRNTPIIVLDEATAFADPDNEDKVQKAFANLTNGKTVIMIAHRLSTVVNADCIYLLKNGEIAEKGTHQQLLQKRGYYADMWKKYQQSVKWKVVNDFNKKKGAEVCA